MTWFDKHERTGRTMAVAAMVALAGTVLAGCGDDDDAAVDTIEETELTETETELTETETETEATETDTATETATATEDGETSAQEEVMVDIVSIDEAFQPSSATVAAGGEVTWANTDDIAHTTTADDGTWDSGNMDPGAEFTFAPEEPGTYAYFCSIHPSMTGELIVE